MMYFRTMGKLHDWEPIQSDQGKAGPFAGRACPDTWTFWEASCQQYRNWIQESEPSCDSFDGDLSRFARETIQGIKRSVAGALKSAKWFLIKGQEMKMKRDYSPSQIIEESLPVRLYAVSEPPLEFLKRKEQVQEMVAKMILLGKKKGRPSNKEEQHEEAA